MAVALAHGVRSRRVMPPREAVYVTLKRAILLNEIQPGAPLTELGIAEEMGCSQGTVREALLRLQEDGLVLRAGHRGTTVTPLDADAAEEMLALRRQIETRAANRATIEGIAPTMRSQLVELIAAMERAASENDSYQLIEDDIRFHMTLFRVAGVQALEPVLHRLMLHTHRQKLWEPRHSRPLMETAVRHHQIIAAIDRGGSALADALGDHIDTIVDVNPGRDER